jgi:hypothetical protein
VAEHYLIKVWESYKQYQHNAQVPTNLREDPLIDDTHWKLSMKVQEPLSASFDKWEDEESEDFEDNCVEAEVIFNDKSVEMDEETEIPKKTYVNFKYTGNK